MLRSDTDSVSFERIINVPARGIGDKTIEVLRAADAREDGSTWAAIEAAARGELPALGARARGALADFAALVRRLRTRVGILALPELLDEALEASGYRAMLADGSEDGEERWANLLELRSVTTRYDDLTPEDALDRLLEETALVADQDSYEGDADAVTLITLHAAKGLEFPIVFIAGLEEGLFPHSRALDDEKELEEERRLAYVGITRAKRRLYLSHAWRRATWGMGQAAVPSRFLLEIPAELMVGPQLGAGAPDRDLDLDLVFGARRATRFGTPTRGAGPRLPAGERPARRAWPRRGVPPVARPGGEARGVRVGGAVRQPRDRPRTVRRGRRNAAGGPATASARHPRRAPVPRRGSGAPRPLGGRHRGDLQAHPERRGGHGGVQGSRGRPQADAREPGQPRDHRVTLDADGLAAIVTLDDFEPLARAAMDPGAYDYVAGGAWEETSLAENVAAWRRRRFRPRVLVDASQVDASTTMLGARSALPVAIAPMAVQGLGHPDGEAAAIRGAAAAGVPYILSTTSSCSIEEVAAAAPDAHPLVPALRPGGHGRIALAGRASGRRGLWRDRPDGRPARPRLPRTRPAVRVRAPAARQLPRHPGDPRQPPSRHARRGHDPDGLDVFAERLDATLTWDDLATIRGWSDLPFVLKGILTAEDARLAVDHGVDGIVVSNHGARQLDRVPGTADVLGEVVAAVDGRTEVWVDGGIRRGLDIAMALALGARGVLVGRPVYWALAAGGAPA